MLTRTSAYSFGGTPNDETFIGFVARVARLRTAACQRVNSILADEFNE